MPRMLRSLDIDRNAVIKNRRQQSARMSTASSWSRRPQTGDDGSRSGSKAKLLQATGTLLLHVGFDSKLETSLMNEDKGCRSHRLLQKAAWEGRIKLSAKECAKLEAEVLTGECTLQCSPEGEIERVVPIEVLRLESQDDQVWVRIGTWERGSPAKAQNELPGHKRGYNECPMEVIRFVLRDEVPDYVGAMLLGEVSEEECTKESCRFHIRTKYMRTVHLASIVPALQRAPRGSGMCPSPVQQVQATVRKGDDLIRLYSWMTEEEFELGQRDEVKEKVHQWIADFQQSVETMLAEVSSATRGRRGDTCIRKLAYLNWWRAGKPEQTQQCKSDGLNVASHTVDEEINNGRSQDELLLEYENDFVSMAMQDFIGNPVKLQELKDCFKVKTPIDDAVMH